VDQDQESNQVTVFIFLLRDNGTSRSSEVKRMQVKPILTAGFAGGLLLLVIMLLSGALANVVLPYTIFDIPGMRPADDPVSILFFLYPFVIAFAAAILFDFLNPALHGGVGRRGLIFGMLLFIIVTIPNQFVIYASMYYPPGFYLSSVITGLIGYPIFGMLCARIWRTYGIEELKSEARGI
jgi:hypothetical protein